MKVCGTEPLSLKLIKPAMSLWIWGGGYRIKACIVGHSVLDIGDRLSRPRRSRSRACKSAVRKYAIDRVLMAAPEDIHKANTL